MVLIIVVIFQADIRRALMRVGSSSLFRGQRTAKETQVIEERAGVPAPIELGVGFGAAT